MAAHLMQLHRARDSKRQTEVTEVEPDYEKNVAYALLD